MSGRPHCYASKACIEDAVTNFILQAVPGLSRRTTEEKSPMDRMNRMDRIVMECRRQNEECGKADSRNND
jgi:hypothetical protein